MPSLKRVASSGSERAEYEHVFGELRTDPTDPRFVLVDEETEEKLRSFPKGVPPLIEQDSKGDVIQAIQDQGEVDKPTSDPGATPLKGAFVAASGVKPDENK